MTLSKQTFNRGDVVLVLFPDSNLQSAKSRPGLVVQANRLNTGLAQIIIAMISTNMARANHPSRVSVLVNSAAGSQSGLLKDSIVMTDNLATIAYSEISRTIGNLPMIEIDVALREGT